jgi:hypothetical protein
MLFDVMFWILDYVCVYRCHSCGDCLCWSSRCDIYKLCRCFLFSLFMIPLCWLYFCVYVLCLIRNPVIFSYCLDMLFVAGVEGLSCLSNIFLSGQSRHLNWYMLLLPYSFVICDVCVYIQKILVLGLKPWTLHWTVATFIFFSSFVHVHAHDTPPPPQSPPWDMA